MSTAAAHPNPLLQRLEGPAPAMEVALDIVRRSVWLVPVAALFGVAFWGGGGALSALYGLAIVVVNLLLSAWLLAAGGRISFAAMAGAAFFGFVLRLALIFVAVLVVNDMSWVRLVPLGVTLIVTHLGLLFWELRYVSGSLAFPGLKPGRPTTHTPTTAPGPGAEGDASCSPS